MDFFGILENAVYAVAALAFFSGLLITSITGAVKPVKTFLWVLTGVFTVIIGIGFFFSRGLLIFLLFQIIALILVWYMFVVFGAVCGGGIWSWQHKQAAKRLGQADISEYLPTAEFCALEGIDEERAVARIKSGYYRGGQFGGAWYIHGSERTQNRAP